MKTKGKCIVDGGENPGVVNAPDPELRKMLDQMQKSVDSIDQKLVRDGWTK